MDLTTLKAYEAKRLASARKSIRQAAAPLILLALLVLIGLTTGCATQRTVEMAQIASDAYKVYVQQEKVASLIELHAAHGQTLELTLSGANKIILNTQVPALSMLPREPDSMRAFMDGAARISGVAAAGFVGYRGVGALEKVATSPTVVTQPAPLIVRPEIITP